MKNDQLSRRDILKILGTGALGVLTFPAMGLTGNQKHLITLSFDDGFKKSSIKTAELYEKYGLSGCINVIATAHLRKLGETDEYHLWPVGDFALWNELKARGHEIMPHTYQHANLTRMPLKDAQVLVEKCIDVFRNELDGFVAKESVFNLAYNASTPELEEWLRSKFRAIRTHGNLINPLPEKCTFRLGCGSHGPDRIDTHLTESIDQFLEGPPGWFIYNTHGLDEEGWGPLSSGVLDELLSRLSGMENVRVLPIVPALDSAYPENKET